MQTERTKTFLLILLISLFGFIYSLVGNRMMVSNHMEIYFLDVGQGDGMLIKTPNNKYGLVDTGKEFTGYAELEKYLPSGIDGLEFVVLTHPDIDHFGMAKMVLEKYKVNYLFMNKSFKQNKFTDELTEFVQDKGITQYSLFENNTFELDGIIFETIWPTSELLHNIDDSNDQSISLLIKYRDFDLATFGDLSSQYEDQLIEKIEEHTNKLDILKVSHHGSRFSTSKEFVEAIDPVNGLIQVGKDNTYGHPTDQVLANLESSGTNIYRTDQIGTIKLEIKQDNYSINKDDYEIAKY